MIVTTKAAVLRTSDGPFGIEDVALDPIGPEDLLVRIGVENGLWGLRSFTDIQVIAGPPRSRS
jgi:Zn-dependent alcohol dehydrogenase